MLARSFMTAKELQLSEIEVTALIEVLHRLERGELTAYSGKFTPSTIFMNDFFYSRPECGTVGCICGWANLISEGEAFPELNGQKISGSWAGRTLSDLISRLPVEAQIVFMMNGSWDDLHNLRGHPSTDTIASNLRKYLTTGSIRE